MWFLFIYLLIAGVQAQPERIRTVLRGTDSPCRGRLEVYYEGEWGSVCHHQWNANANANGLVVCKSLGCGKHINSNQLNNLPIINRDFPPPTTMWMDEVECNGSESSIWDCKAKKKSKFPECNRERDYIVVECAGKISLSLNTIGYTDECAGVVQFNTPDGTVSVCNDNWNEATADMVCEELDCGKHHKIPKPGTFQGKPRTYTPPLSCIGNKMLSWQCVDWVNRKSNDCQREASVICSKHKRMRLSGGEDLCSGVLQKNTTGSWNPVPFKADMRNMADDICLILRCGKSTHISESNSTETFLKCIDRVKVELSNKRFGDLYVKVNETPKLVCSGDLTETEQKQIGTVVCKQLGFGKLLEISTGKTTSQGEQLYQVDCTGEEDSLWDCLKRQPTGVCRSSKVVCAALEEVQLQDGYSNCSGRLEVKLEGSWWRVRSSDWTNNSSDVVCKQLGCGGFQSWENNVFVESDKSFLKWKLKCNKDVNDLSQCLGDQWESDPKADERSVNIVCERNKFYGLQGDRPCEGTAFEVSGGKNVILTLEEDKWNDVAYDICKQMRCGSVLSFKTNLSDPQPSENPLCSYSTSDLTSNSTSNSTSIPTCTTNNKDTQHTHLTTAYIKCTDFQPLTVKLENSEGEKCWGKVKVCRGSTCEGVCGKIWKEKQSERLCNNLNCGSVIPGQFEGPTVVESVTIGSIYCPDETKTISQCTFFNLTKSSCSSPAYVACAGSVKAKLTDPRKKCAGKAELFYSGMWHSVCSDASSAFQNTICKTLGCGNVLNFTQSGNKEPGVSKITCKNENITSCTVLKSCSVGHLECEAWRRLLITTDHACSGRVYAESKQGPHGVSREGWSETEGEKLCDYLQCKRYRGYNDHPLQHNLTTYPLWNKSYNCRNSSKDIWDCEVEKEPTMLQQLEINCDGEPDITLEGNCTGQVIINRHERVCWEPQNTGRVLNELCQQLKCSSFLMSWENKTVQSGHSFKCNGNENNLWQCSSSNKTCGSVLSLACADAVQFRFTGNCGGKLEVNYRGEWKTVGFKSKDDADVICEHKQCGKAESLMGPFPTTEILFECENRENHPKHCIKVSPGNYETTVRCEKYVPVVVVPAPNTALIVGLVIGLLFLLLAIIIGIWQRKTLLAMLRLRPAGKDEDVELSSNEMQDLNERNDTDLHERKSSMFEIDNYEEVDPIMNQEDEESKNQELQPDEEEGGSGGSSMTEYDDVEERNEKPIRFEDSSPAEPLLPPRPPNLLGDVSYEVELEELEEQEELEEDYDDAAPAVQSPEPGDMSGGNDEQVRQTEE
ncbi:scavenger receptor cysteine-rich type 1 protein M160 [Astyanax mexicanus]|uniref:scavenger receptor cysteine-rich type 1 protein M160 n=1 Tax=Astyanax mexicanus TaxID=7994 RepID=UPI0020CAE6AB|nr:scavenger receptor cysteine-rich type 1 protein M160 [Astyanax mexicanus]